jgi:hypothetical protein
MKFNLSEIVQTGKQLLRDTAIEVLLLGALGAAVGTGLSCNYEERRTEKIPLGFCEIREIEKDAERAGKKVGPMTHFLATTNDATMKIFECWNDSHEFTIGRNDKGFVDKLYDTMDPAAKIFHYDLKDLIEVLPERVGGATAGLARLLDASNRIAQMDIEFGDAWSYSSTDHYRTEYYTETETYTSNGKTHTRTVTKSRQVYDHTTHYYTYRKEHGEKAASLLTDLVGKKIGLDFETLQTANRTNAEGEGAALKSRDTEDKMVRLTDLELLNIANTWAKGSTFVQNTSTILDRWGKVPSHANSWNESKRTARSVTYDTNSRFDSGPREYRVAQGALQNGKELYSNAAEIFSGINYVAENAPKIPGLIAQLNQIEFHHGEGNGREVANEIMDIAKTMYKENFPQGFEVDRFREYMLALWGLVGMVAGAAAGFGLDRAGQKFDWYKDARTKLGSRRFDGF